MKTSLKIGALLIIFAALIVGGFWAALGALVIMGIVAFIWIL